MKKLVIGIAGGTGSGKTSVTNKILDRLNAHENHESVVVIQHDSYYRDISEYGGLTGDKINFDHPDSLETDLLVEHIRCLQNGQSIEQPLYNFTTHSRMAETRKIEPKTITIIEGILIYSSKALRDLMNIKIFIDTDADERLLRRLKRDLIERGRSIESVMNQYVNTVKPMHVEFVEPSKIFADIIIPRGSENAVAIDMVAVKIEQMLYDKAKTIIAS